MVITKKVPIQLWTDDSGVGLEVPPPKALPLGDYELSLIDAEVGIDDDYRIAVGVIFRRQRTFWFYYLNKYFIPSEVIERSRRHDGGRFYFNVGQEFGDRVWAESDELEKCFTELGLLERSKGES